MLLAWGVHREIVGGDAKALKAASSSSSLTPSPVGCAIACLSVLAFARQAWCLFAADSYTLLNVPDSENDILYGSLSFTFCLFALEVRGASNKHKGKLAP